MADIIYLVDGSSIEGEIIEVSNDSITIKTENGIFEISKNKILKIEFISDKNDNNSLREQIRKALEKLKNEINNLITIVITIDNFNFNFNFNFSWNNNNNNNNDNNWNDNDNWNNNNNDNWNNNNNDNWNNNNNDNWNNNNNDNWYDDNNNDNSNNWSNNDNDSYNWDNDDNGEGNHHYVKVGKNLILSIGYVSLFDPFYTFDQPFYQFGINVGLSKLNSPFSFVASINLAYNVFIDYPGFGTILASFWNIYSVGGEVRIPNLIVTPFAGLSLGIHHLYIPFVDKPNHYGTPAFTIYGGVEFSIKDILKLQLYLKKNISLSNENFSWGFYYDQNFYDALFGYFQIGFNIYFNINL